MTVTVKTLIPAKQAEDALTTQYTATNCKARIDKFTVTNTTGAADTFVAHVVPPAGTADATNQVLSKTIQPGETYLCPELIGQVLEAGGLLSTIAGTAATLTITASGIEIT